MMERVWELWMLSSRRDLFGAVLVWDQLWLAAAGCLAFSNTMSFFSSANPTSVTTSTSTTGDKDIEITEPPPDSISSLSFSSQADYLAVGSWDNSVCSLCQLLFRFRLVPLGSNLWSRDSRADTRQGYVSAPRPRLVNLLEQGTPFLFWGLKWVLNPLSGRYQDIFWWCWQRRSYVRCHDWSSDTGCPTWRAYQGCQVDRGSADGNSGYWELGQDNQSIFSSPFGICYNLTCISTGIWDHRVLSLPFNYRRDVIHLTCNILYSSLEQLSATYRYSTSTTQLLLIRFSTSAPMTKTYWALLQTMTSPLKWQTRVVSCFTASQNNGFAVGSVEGRVAIQWVCSTCRRRKSDKIVIVFRYVEESDST